MKRIAFLALLALACNRQETPRSVQNAAPRSMESTGNAARGKELINQYGCNVCHVVPGVEGPAGILGPSLAGMASHPTISNGVVQNTPENLLKFIQNPPTLNPQSAMPPPMGMTPDDAKDLVAFLQTLK